jgi:hypothetical protein
MEDGGCVGSFLSRATELNGRVMEIDRSTHILGRSVGEEYWRRLFRSNINTVRPALPPSPSHLLVTPGL